MSVEQKVKMVLFSAHNNNKESKKEKSDSSLVQSLGSVSLRCISLCKNLVLSIHCVQNKRNHTYQWLLCVYHVAKDVVMKRTKIRSTARFTSHSRVLTFQNIVNFFYINKITPHSSPPTTKEKGEGGGGRSFYLFYFYSSVHS